MFNITKENTTLTEADFAVDLLCATKGALFIALFVMFGVCFIMWEINFVIIRLIAFTLFTTIGIYFILVKYLNVLQEHIKDIK